MPRRRGADNREVAADPVFNSTLAEKFICSMMWDGKKPTAQKIFYSSMQKAEEGGGGEEASNLKKRGICGAGPSRSAMMCTGWRKQIRRSRTIAGNCLNRNQ